MGSKILGPIFTSGQINPDGSGATFVRLEAVIDGRDAELIGVVSHPEPFRFHVFEAFDDPPPGMPAFRVYPELEKQFEKIAREMLPTLHAFAEATR